MKVMHALDDAADKTEKILDPVRVWVENGEPEIQMRILDCRAKAVEEVKDG